MEKSTNVKDLLNEMLSVTYFGFDYKEKDTEKIKNICCEKAYLDMCRTLRFGEDKTKKYVWKSDVQKIVIESINDLSKLAEKIDQDSFDIFHKKECKKMIKVQQDGVFSDDNSFTVGQAQKWINMTYKYLLLLGYWNDKTEVIKKLLHAPVDNYIIQSASIQSKSGKSNAIRYGLDVKKPEKEAWSKWKSYTKYLDYEKKLRERVYEEYEDKYTLIEWECLAWNEQAKKEEEKEYRKKLKKGNM